MGMVASVGRHPVYIKYMAEKDLSHRLCKSGKHKELNINIWKHSGHASSEYEQR